VDGSGALDRAVEPASTSQVQVGQLQDPVVVEFRAQPTYRNGVFSYDNIAHDIPLIARRLRFQT